jgi:site-specific DNA-methyltransferase (adenine-specific)
MKNELIHGDALAVLPTLPAASFDALITDPPYASGGVHAASRQQAPSAKYIRSGLHDDFVGDERDQRSHLAWMRLWLAECSRVLKDGAPVLLFTDWRQLPLTTDALQCAGFTWRGVAVWDKTEGVRPQLGRFRNQAEYVVWGSKGNMPLGRRAPVLPGVIRESVRKADKHHMTGKPTDLMRQLVRICETGGRILDPFAGSGTTLVAADLEGYGWTGIEMTGHYHDVARSRLLTA